MAKNNKLLEVSNLSKYFVSGGYVNQAINDISFEINQNEVLGLIGQSGSGKTTTGKAIIRLLKEVNGFIVFDGRIISGKYISRENRKYLRRNIQMIFQNPHDSLSPKRNIYSTISEPLVVSGVLKEKMIDVYKYWPDVTFNFELSFLNEVISGYGKYLDEIVKVKSLVSALDGTDPEKIESIIVDLKEGIFKIIKTLVAFESDIFKIYDFQKGIYISGKGGKLEADYQKNKKQLILAKKDLELKTRGLSEFEKGVEKEFEHLRKTTKNNFKSILKSYKEKSKFYKEVYQNTTKTTPYLFYLKEYLKVMAIKRNFKTLKIENNFIHTEDFINIVKDVENSIDIAIGKKTKGIKDKKMLISFYNEIKIDTTKYKKYLVSSELFDGNKLSDKEKLKSIIEDINITDDNIESIKNNLELTKNIFLEDKTSSRDKDFKDVDARLKKLSPIIKKTNNIDKEIKEKIKEINTTLKKLPDLKIARKQLDSIILMSKEIPLLKKRVINSLKLLKINTFRFDDEKIFREKKYNNEIQKINFKNKRVLKSIIKRREIYSALEKVGLKAEHSYRYPHEFSGGQAQRIAIAKALIVEPKLLIADEPIASLDVSIQAQVINILTDLVKENNMSMLFIAHDLSMVEYVADKVAIMHLGKLVEWGKADKVFKKPCHPYTKTLIHAIPKLENSNQPFITYENVNSYLFEYSSESTPKEVEIQKNHFILATDKQIKKWNNDK